MKNMLGMGATYLLKSIKADGKYVIYFMKFTIFNLKILCLLIILCHRIIKEEKCSHEIGDITVQPIFDTEYHFYKCSAYIKSFVYSVATSSISSRDFDYTKD